MKHIFLIPLALAACTVPDDQPGVIYEITEYTVTVRGSSTYSGPTQAMQAQAKEICPGAEYIAANPYVLDYGAGMIFYQSLYLFRC